MSEHDKPVLVDEDDILAYTHQQRLHMLSKVIVNGALPEDPAAQKVAVSLLKDMDAAALGRKRIKVEEKIADNQEAAAAVIAKVLGASASAKPYQLNATDVIARPAPELGAEVPPPRLVEGETAVASTQDSFESFTARVAALVPESAGDK